MNNEGDDMDYVKWLEDWAEKRECKGRAGRRERGLYGAAECIRLLEAQHTTRARELATVRVERDEAREECRKARAASGLYRARGMRVAELEKRVAELEGNLAPVGDWFGAHFPEWEQRQAEELPPNWVGFLWQPNSQTRHQAIARAWAEWAETAERERPEGLPPGCDWWSAGEGPVAWAAYAVSTEGKRARLAGEVDLWVPDIPKQYRGEQ